jgi:malic enzyme
VDRRSTERHKLVVSGTGASRTRRIAKCGEKTHVVTENILTWEQNGVRYQLRADLTHGEMLKIAESLQ